MRRHVPALKSLSGSWERPTVVVSRFTSSHPTSSMAASMLAQGLRGGLQDMARQLEFVKGCAASSKQHRCTGRRHLRVLAAQSAVNCQVL